MQDEVYDNDIDDDDNNNNYDEQVLGMGGGRVYDIFFFDRYQTNYFIHINIILYRKFYAKKVYFNCGFCMKLS